MVSVLEGCGAPFSWLRSANFDSSSPVELAVMSVAIEGGRGGSVGGRTEGDFRGARPAMGIGSEYPTYDTCSLYQVKEQSKSRALMARCVGALCKGGEEAREDKDVEVKSAKFDLEAAGGNS